jgi:hypothetical protein
MESIGLVDRCAKAAANIALGRAGLASDGSEHEGRLA